MKQNKLKALSALLAAAMSVPSVFAIQAQEPESLPTDTIVSASTEQDFASISDLVQAATETQITPAANEIVTMIVELEDAPLLERKEESQSMQDYLSSVSGISARERLESQQNQILSALKKQRSTSTAQLEYAYTVVMNGFSIKAPYETMDTIASMDGVKSVRLARTYDYVEPTQGYTQATHTSGAMIDSDRANAEGYTGKGTVTAILDTGLDVAHEAYQQAPNSPAWDKDTIESFVQSGELNANASADDLYNSAKIPFAYDYADQDLNVLGPQNHGTHVAGSVGASSEDFSGVAPDTQIVVMKVFSDAASGASDSWIFAALEDAVVLGVDTINMSLGSASGFTNSVDSDPVYNRVMDAGISLMCAAGNDTDAVNGTNLGTNLPLVSEPDSGIVGSPSTYTAAMSVASVNEATMFSQYLLNGDNHIIFNDSNAGTAMDFVTSLDGQTLEYVTIPGFGYDSDFAQVDVKGKIALVSRGDISFTDKEANAYAAGAAALIVFDNVEGELISMAVNGLLPTIFISKADGALMRKASEKTLTISSEFSETTETEESGRMSDFSSLGVAPDLSLKPEITAPGGNVYSTLPGDTYGNMNGTSMASPHMAGAASVMRQYVEETWPELSKTEQMERINTLLMNTATPVLDASDTAVTPRKQGAGLAQVYNAIHTPAMVEVVGSTRPKIELKDSPDGYFSKSFTLKVTNFSDEEVSYIPEITPLVAKTEEVRSNGKTYTCISNDSRLLSESEFKAVFSTNSITLAPGASAEVEVHLTLTSEGEKNLAVFENGIYLDGFVTLKSQQDDNIDLSLPYLGFYGDWGAASVFDDSIYDDEEASVYATSMALIDLATGNGYYLGTNLLDSESDEADENKIAFASRSLGYYRPFSMTGLLRAPETITYTVTDDEGDEVFNEEVEHPTKSFFYSSGGLVFYEIGPGMDGWLPVYDGGDGFLYYLPDGDYTWNMTAQVAGTTSAASVQTESFPIVIDNESPEILSTRYEVIDGVPYVIVSVTDNHYVMGMQMISSDETSAYSSGVPLSEDEAGAVSEVAFDVSRLQADGVRTAKLLLYDYALNETVSDTFSIISNDIQAESIRINNREIHWTGGGTRELDVFIEPENTTDKTITWTSSDESLATVVATDRVNNLGAHVSILTAANANGQVTLTASLPGGASDSITLYLMALTTPLPEDLTITENGTYSLPEALSNKTIQIADGVTDVVLIAPSTISADNPYTNLQIAPQGEGLHLSLDNFHDLITNGSAKPIVFTGANNTLSIRNSNSIAHSDSSYNSAALVGVNEGTELTINGSGTLDLKSAFNIYGALIGGAAGKNGGKITVDGGTLNLYNPGSGAGIGGGSGRGSEKITINGGNINIELPFVSAGYMNNLSYTASGIGTGNAASGLVPVIEINGGTIIGHTNSNAPVIGNGFRSSIGFNLTVNGGKIDATADQVTVPGGSVIMDGTSAIGSGYSTTGSSSITINGGEIIALSNGRATAIGSGVNSPSPTLTINGGTITAESTTLEIAAIGAEKYGTKAYMQISGGSVKATAPSGTNAINVSSLMNDDYENVQEVLVPALEGGEVSVNGVSWNISAKHPNDDYLHLWLPSSNGAYIVTQTNGTQTTNQEVYVYANGSESKSFYSFETQLEGLSFDGPSILYEGENLTGTLRVLDSAHYQLPSSVRVSVNGEEVDATYDAQSGLVEVDASVINGPVVLMATAAARSDKTELSALISQCEALDENLYTPSSWSALLSALNAATEIYNGDQADQDAVDAAYQALLEALNGLTARADLSALQEVVAQAQTYTYAQYTSAGWDEFVQALADAQALLSNFDTSSEEAEQAAQRLTDAMNALVPVADKTALRQELDNVAVTIFKVNYTEESWNRSGIEQAIAQAKEVLANHDASQDETDIALANLKAAVEKLSLTADFSALEALIQTASSLKEENYTPASWNVLTEKLAAAIAVVNNPDALQSEIDQAQADLAQAIAALQQRADFSALNEAIAHAQSLNEEDYTPASWSAANPAQVIADALAVAQNADASQSDVNAAIQALADMEAALQTRADFAALNTLIEQAQAVDSTLYTPASAQLLADMLEEAQEIASDANATQTEVDAAVVRLQDALDHLVEKADKTALLALVNQYKDLNESGYTPASWEVFAQALTDALTVVNDEDATQESVDAALETLQNAVDQLVVINDEVVNKTLLEAAVAYALNAKEEPSYETVNIVVKTYFEEALTEAQSVLADEYTTQVAVDAAWQKLTKAIHMLNFTSDKGALAAAVEQAKEIQNELDTYEGDKEAFLAALEYAEEVLASDTALDETIQDALRQLEEAMANLSKKDVQEFDTTLLELLVNISESTDLSRYVENGQDAFLAALEAAQSVLASPESQEQIDEATATLHTAYMNLRLKADESLLEQLATAADILSNIDRSLYTDDVLASIDGCREMILALLADPNNASAQDAQKALDLSSQLVETIKSTETAEKQLTTDALTASKAESATTKSVSTATMTMTGFYAFGATVSGFFAFLKRKRRNR